MFSQSSTSTYYETNLQVPKGSVLGPLLFRLHINDLKDSPGIARSLRLLHADDLQIYIQVPANKCEIEKGIRVLSDLARLVGEWAELNHLTLDPKKTKAIIFGPAHTIKFLKTCKHRISLLTTLGIKRNFLTRLFA